MFLELFKVICSPSILEITELNFINTSMFQEKSKDRNFVLLIHSVKGPELINMYVGQSEQNVRDGKYNCNPY